MFVGCIVVHYSSSSGECGEHFNQVEHFINSSIDFILSKSLKFNFISMVRIMELLRTLSCF
jgi:hypothetical protein